MSTVSPLTPGVFGVAPPTTTTTTAAPTTTTTVPPELNTAETNTATAPDSTCTFTDTTNGLTIVRSASSAELSISPANWDYIEVTYDLGSGVVTDRLYKLNSTPATVGVLTRDTPTRLTIQLNSSTGFTLKILYDRQPLKTCVVPAVGVS